MFKFLCKSVVFIALCSVSSWSLAASLEKSIERIMEVSGLTTQASYLPDLIRVGMEQARQEGAPIPDEEFRIMLESASETILPSEILQSVQLSLQESISKEETESLLAWFESDLGKEITAVEESASTAEAYQQMMMQAQSLLQNSERVAFAKRLDALVGATDMGVDLQEFSGMAVYTAVMMVMWPNEPLDLTPFKAEMDATRAQTHAAMEQMTIVSLVYSYQALDDKKLSKYEAFLSTPTAKKFNKVVMGSIKTALEASISKWAKRLAVMLKENRQQTKS